MTQTYLDVHNKTSAKVLSVIPDFIESDHPKFAEFVKAYYRFLEQHDELPLTATFTNQSGVVSVQLGNSIVVGANTTFSVSLSPEQRLRVGSDIFRVRSIASNTALLVYELPVRSYFANVYSAETDKTIRQASGAIRQVLAFHDIENTLSSFIPYFRDTYMRDLPQGFSDTKALLAKVLDFYQAKGSENAFRFLFRALYGLEIDMSYPRDKIFTTSAGEFETSSTIRLSRRDPDITWAVNASPAPSSLLELRQIVGLTSNARATVSRVLDAYDGPKAVAALSVADVIINRTLGNLLLNSDVEADDGNAILATAHGTPPQGLTTVVYDFNLVQEIAQSNEFLPGETISTVPEVDPLAIRGVIVGTVVSFPVVDGGEGYLYGDLIYPSGNTNGGYGAVGRVIGFANVDITSISIVDGGEGYYATPSLSLSVDNSGTGGGSGLAGHVTAVAPGHILTEANEVLIFSTYSPVEVMTDYQASRETVNYYEVGVSLADLFNILLVNSNVPEDDGDALLFDDATGTDYQWLMSAVTLNAPDWGPGDTLIVNNPRVLASAGVVATDPLWYDTALLTEAGDTVRVNDGALHGYTLASIISGLVSVFSVLPIYVAGVRAEIGGISAVTATSFGSGYISGLPSIAVNRILTPTDSSGRPLSDAVVPYEPATLVPVLALGQIGAVEVVTGGSGYSGNANFSVTEDMTSSAAGHDAILGMNLGALSATRGRNIGTGSQLSADKKLQDIYKYNPFSYVITAERDKSVYEEPVRETTHPAGGLLLSEHTITSVVNLVMTAVTSVQNLWGNDAAYPSDVGTLTV